MDNRFKSIPATACMLAGGMVEIGDNGENAKTAPVKLTARSGQPIEHPYWGFVVHDMDGIKIGKKRLPIDYAHNDSEVLGYLSHFETETGDLVTSGALTPFRDDDRASEVLFKMRAGVPYEASIYFGGDGLKIQEVMEGETAPVNGYMFNGPGVIIREWPLRGVAICPYGADSNTESMAMSTSKQFTASQWTQPKGEQMTAEEQAAADKAKADEQKAIDDAAVEAAKLEAATKAEAEAKAVEAAAVEAAALAAAAEAEKQLAKANDPREQFKKMCAEFGNEIASTVFASGGTYEDAKNECMKQLKAENASLHERIAALSAGGTASACAAASNGNKKLTLVDMFEKGTRKA